MSMVDPAPIQIASNPKIDCRIFSIEEQFTRQMRWFFRAREGVMGPYESREAAAHMLLEFTEQCQLHGLTGNR